MPLPEQLGFDDQGDDAALVAYVKAAGWQLWARADGSKPVWADPKASIDERASHSLADAVRTQRARDAVPERSHSIEAAARADDHPSVDSETICVCGHPYAVHTGDELRAGEPWRCNTCYRCDGFWDVRRGPRPGRKRR